MMNHPNLQPIIDRLRQRKPYASLAPKQLWDEQLDMQISQLPGDALAEHDPAKLPYADAFKSGLHLWNESLEHSHTLSQSVHNSTGSYWHGIMHRMEADYSNAQYWFHQVGEHPVFALLYERTAEFKRANSHSAADGLLDRLLAKGEWDPYLFVELVESALNSSDPIAIEILEQVQHTEMSVLLDYTYRKCCGGA